MDSVNFGVMLPIMVPSGPKPLPPYHALQYLYNKLDVDLVKKCTDEAERLGFHSVWVSDHLSREVCKERLECWTTMTWLASITEKIRVGSMVLCNLYRNPSLLAKMASTLDVISEGRLEFGIGACWSEDECIDRGIDWPKPSTRIGMLREAVEVCKNLWTREKSTYKGKYYQLEKVFSEPKPLQKPYPPIMIGGGGEQLTLELVAQHADKSNFGGPVDVVKRKLEILKEHCEKSGRDFNEIEKTMNIGVVVKPTYEEYVEDMKKRWTANGRPDSFDAWFEKTDSIYVSGTPEDCINQIQQYVEIGIKLIIIRFGDIPDLDGLRLFSEKVVPHFT